MTNIYKRLIICSFFFTFIIASLQAQNNFIPRGLDINGEATMDLSGQSVSMPDVNTIAIGASNNDGSGIDAGHVRIYTWNGLAWVQKGIDINGEAAGDISGASVSMPDANTIAIGAPNNDGNGSNSGHVRIYSWNGSSWVQKGVDINGELTGDQFGYSVSMPDANTVAIGAVGNDGTGSGAGHVRVYSWNGSAWSQNGVDIDGEAAGDQFGYSVSMPNANYVAIGSPTNDGNGTNAGNVRIYYWDGSSWTQVGADIDGESAGDNSGFSVSMPDNNTLAIGAPNNQGQGTNAGQARIFSWTGSAWVQKGIDLDAEAANDLFGRSVSMPDPNTIAVGAPNNDGIGIDAGHARLFRWNGTGWVQKGIDFNGEAAGDFSGWSVCMPDSNSIAIGAYRNTGGAGHAKIFSKTADALMINSANAGNDYITLGSVLNTTISNANCLSIEVWVKPISYTPVGSFNIDTSVIIGNYYTAGSLWQFVLRKEALKWAFCINTSSGITRITTTSNSVVADQWQHIAGVWDGQNQTMKLFINGALEATLNNITGTLVTTTNPVFIGNNNSPGLLKQDFYGAIDELRIWTKPLCSDQINNNLNCQIPNVFNGLLANHHFNEGYAGTNNNSDTKTFDATGSGFNGTLTNFALSGNTSNWISPGAVTAGFSCIAFTSTITVSAASQTNISCIGASNGSATVSISDGVATAYDWTPGNPTGDGTASASGLSAGSWTCTVTNDCGQTGSYVFNITEPMAISSSQTLTLCAGQSVTVGTNTYDATGVYTDILTAANGCDSTVTTNLTVDLAITGSQTLTLCAGQSVTVGTNTYDASGVYTDVLTAVNGCDSTVTTNLTIAPAITGSQTLALCAGQSITVGMNTYNATGVYTDVFTAANGCDSTFTTNLTVNPAITGSQTLTLCAGQSVTVGANTYNTSGIFTDVFTAADGCDSTFTTNLTVNDAITGSQTLTICSGQSVTVGTNTYNTTGVFIDILSAANGCDSTVTTNLTVENAIDVSTTTNAETIIANHSGATFYQWIDCDNSNQAIAGETNQSFTAVANGNYAVIVTINSCSETSTCVNINSVGIKSIQNQSLISLYPNPSKGIFNLEGLKIGSTIEVYNALGEKIFLIEAKAVKTTINILEHPNGIYFIKTSDNQIFKLIKQD